MTFHDGSPFSADDVVFTFERARMAGSQMKGRIPDGAQFSAVDRYTFDVHLTEPNPVLPADWESLLIMSRQWAVRHGLTAPMASADPTPALPANGTGAYRVLSHEPGRIMRFERNDAWWGRDARMVEQVDLFTLENAQTRTAALLAGQVDVIVPAPVQDLVRFSKTPGFKTLTGPELRTIFLNMDQMRETLVGAAPGTPNPFKDRRVREAVSHAIDIDTIRRVVMRGQSVPAASLVSPLVLPGIAKIDRRAHDPVRARRLLEAAGYAGGFDVEMDCPNNLYVNDEQICLAVVQMLANVGIRVRLNSQPKALYFKKVLSGGGYDSAFNLLGWTPGAIDAWNVLHNLARCRDAAGNGARFNLGGYCNDDIDRLTRQALTEGVTERRDQLMLKAFRIIHEDVGFIPLHQQALAWAMSARIKTAVRADNQIKFDTIRLARPRDHAMAGRETAPGPLQ